MMRWRRCCRTARRGALYSARLRRDGKETEAEWDNSAFSLSGDITDHRDGTVTIKMGKPTDLEDAYEMLLGGDEV